MKTGSENPAYAWYVVLVLMLAYTISFIDRQILSLMVGPIRADLGLSDTEISLLHGLAFALFYTFLGIPFGWLADHRNRRNLIAAGMSTWGLATAACGFAGSFWQLFGARVTVGVGEAALSPAAYSIISDYFTPARRGRALGIYSMGVFVGAGLAYIVGGEAIALAGGLAADLADRGIDFRPWQLVFVIVGLPALGLLPLLATVREPIRRERGQLSGEAMADLRAGAASIWRRRSFYIAVMLALSMPALVNYAFFAWVPSYFVRSFGWSAREIGRAFGLILLTFGAAGMWAGGYLGDRLLGRGERDGHIRVVGWGSVGAVLPAAVFSRLADPHWTLLALGVLVFFLGFHIPLGPAILHSVTANELRGQVIAVYFFILNMVGLGMGPTLVAATSDFVLQDEMAIGTALGVVAVVVLPLSAWLFARVRRRHYAPGAAGPTA